MEESNRHRLSEEKQEYNAQVQRSIECIEINPRLFSAVYGATNDLYSHTRNEGAFFWQPISSMLTLTEKSLSCFVNTIGQYNILFDHW